jgi:PAS domain S-box-containing protein
MEEHPSAGKDVGNPAPGPATILVVDDDAGNRQSFGWLFRRAGYTTLEASGGMEALQVAQQGIDLAVLDVNLPDIDGFEVCRRLKAQPQTRSVSVIHVSAVYIASQDRTHGLEGGADAYLVKPVEPRELLATVHALLRIRAAEEAARRAAQEWQTTFDAIGDPVCLLDRNGVVRRSNRTLGKLVGWESAALVGQPIEELLRKGLGLEEAPALGLGPGEPAAPREVREVRLGERWFRVTVDPLPSTAECGMQSVESRTESQAPSSPHSGGRVCILTEVTQTKELEEQLRQAQRLEAVGRLAGGVAHDFNNLLTIIVGNVALLRNTPGLSALEAGQIAAIEAAAWRAADLTSQLLGFSRRTLLWLKVVQLNDTVRDVASNLAALAESGGVQVRLQCAADLWPVRVDGEQVGRVVHSLCSNALEAMPGGGALTIQTTNALVSEEHVRHTADARPGAFVRISVADTGGGIPAEVLPHIFDPFYTTKPVGRGQGLGLAMVHGIVKQHLGWVECHSPGPGQGTTFELYLPRSEIAPRAQPGSSEPQTILLVEDHDLLRSLAQTYLRQNGFQVMAVCDEREALALFRAGHPPLRLALLGSPAPVGGPLLAALAGLAPPCPVLLARAQGETSTGQGSEEETSRPGVAGLVCKPYDEHDLIRAVRAALQ